ncbi:hypothetical protein THRCLA_03705 [Thraustotheca clavata]|uniref:Transmembrane protein n=1 Tax=Thraustotheca clavata TaxID=74557 RepID=A0A1W0A182_9STRA|nr:hypothetical protein THRCLA_03705 [Thraustotheca clavata]
MVYVAVPVSVTCLVRDIVEMVRSSMGHDDIIAQAVYLKISTVPTSLPVPTKWLQPNINSFGGSPLCPEQSAPKRVGGGFSSILAYDLSCIPASPVLCRSVWNRQTLWISFVLSGLLSSPPSNFRSICGYDLKNIDFCLVYLSQTLSFLQTYVPQLNSTAMTTTYTEIHHLVQSMNIEFMVYTKLNSTAPLQLLHTNVLDPSDPNFYFFGWTYMIDWVFNNREVISFQGDNGNLTLLTDYQIPLAQQVQPAEITTNFVRYCRAGVLYVTFMMLCLSFVLVGYMVVTKGEFEGYNMFKLDRVGGIVWVGRPLLLLRSITALCLLSTGELGLEYSGYMSYFTATPPEWYKVLLGAWEIAWFVSVVDDVFLVVTQEYASVYANPNSFLVCTLAALVSGIAPVEVTGLVNKQCSIVQVDFQVVCTSGTIFIGQIQRFALLIGMMTICSTISLAITRLYVGKKPKTPATSLLLSIGAKYHFTHGNRIIEGVYYLDRASAALNGILTLRGKSYMVALDVKLWRAFVTPDHGGNTLKTRQSYPLPD